MEDGEKFKPRSGFISPGGRVFFFSLALIPAAVLMLGALLTEAPDFFIAAICGLVFFVPLIVVLLGIGRSVEYVREAEWRGSPDSLPNAPLRYRVWAVVLIVLSNLPILQELIRDVSLWPFWLMASLWNTVVMWLFLHFFAVKIFRSVERLLKRGKQGL